MVYSVQIFYMMATQSTRKTMMLGVPEGVLIAVKTHSFRAVKPSTLDTVAIEIASAELTTISDQKVLGRQFHRLPRPSL